MLSVSGATRVFVASEPVDLRSGYHRLYGLVIERLQQDPLSGHLFLFTNKERDRIKVLWWDGSGLWLCAKKLQRGRFSWPRCRVSTLSLRGEEFSALVSGLEVVAKANWYRR